MPDFKNISRRISSAGNGLNRSVVFSCVGAAAILIVSGVCGNAFATQVSSLDAQRATAEQAISDLDAKRQQLEGASTLTDADAARQMQSAKALADKVAEAQNDYMAASDDASKAADIARGISDVFADDSKSEAALWFVPVQGTASWTSYVTYDTADNVFDVVWLCHDGSGQILCVGHGTYDDGNNGDGAKLEKVSHETTVIGNGASSSKEDQQQQLQQNIDAVGNAVDEAGHETGQIMSEDDAQSIADAREKAREDAGVDYSVPDPSSVDDSKRDDAPAVTMKKDDSNADSSANGDSQANGTEANGEQN